MSAIRSWLKPIVLDPHGIVQRQAHLSAVKSCAVSNRSDDLIAKGPTHQLDRIATAQIADRVGEASVSLVKVKISNLRPFEDVLTQTTAQTPVPDPPVNMRAVIAVQDVMA